MQHSTRFNEYRIMWVMVFFDMPTQTSADRKQYSRFRKNLLKDGFGMFQYSIYIRHCMSREFAQKHMRRVRQYLPKKGKIVLFTLTDKQFGMIEVYSGRDSTDTPKEGAQLEMF
jgi:CRISPR-associated protein Cas2